MGAVLLLLVFIELSSVLEQNGSCVAVAAAGCGAVLLSRDLPWKMPRVHTHGEVQLGQGKHIKISDPTPLNNFMFYYTFPLRCKVHATKIPFMYSFSGNCAASVPISTFMCLWDIYIFPGSVNIFGCSKIDSLILERYKSLTDI
jgi:hypothetical protein